MANVGRWPRIGPARILGIVFAGLTSAYFISSQITGTVCDQTESSYVLGKAQLLVYPIIGARPGVVVSADASTIGCISHPTAVEHLANLLTSAHLLLWLAGFILLFQVTVAAEDSGPFTRRVLRLLRIAGLSLAAGAVAAAAVEGIGHSILLNHMFRTIGPGLTNEATFLPHTVATYVPLAAGVVALGTARLVQHAITVAERTASGRV